MVQVSLPLPYKKFVLAVDVGATNTRLGMFGLRERADLLFSAKPSTASPINAINDFLKKSEKIYGIKTTILLLGVAGRVLGEKIKLTNKNLVIKTDEILRRTPIKKVTILNDVEAMAYGLKLYDIERAVLIVPGTGLGKAVLNGKVMPSEGGHCLIPIINKKFHAYAKFKEWEDALSGRGLTKMEKFSKNSRDLFGEYLGAYCQEQYKEHLLPIVLSESILQPKMFGKSFKKYKKNLDIEVIDDDFLGLKGLAEYYLSNN